MKVLGQHIYSKAIYARAREWALLVTITGSTQVLVQIIGFTCGILIIRMLSTEEYALYTLANTTLGTMTMFADGGIATGVMAEGGKLWQEREKLGAVISTGLDLRKKFALIGVLIAVPALFLLLLHHGASWLMSLIIACSLFPAFYAGLSATLLEIAPKLKQDITPLQRNQMEVNIGRLGMLALTIFVFPWAFVAVLAAGLPQLWGNYRLRKISSNYADLNQKPVSESRKSILKFVKLILPYSIYFCLSGQITVWLLSVFGSTEAVAQIGALGRLAIMLSLFNVLFSTLITPRFARLPVDSKLLLSRYMAIQAVVGVLSMGIISVIWIYPAEVLWILGDDYSGLEYELILSTIGSCIALIASVSFSLYTSRGWAINPLLAIPLNIVSIVCAALIFDVSTLIGILYLNIFVAAFQAFMNYFYSVVKMVRVKQ